MYEPQRIARALRSRQPGKLKTGGRLMIIARDHPTRGTLGAGGNSTAMTNCIDVLERCVEVLSRPGVNGFLDTAGIIEDLTLLGALEGKLVYGSMNRMGLQGAKFEMDDRLNCYDPAGAAAAHLDGGKTLTRINLAGLATANALKITVDMVNAMSQQHLVTMIEPFMSNWINNSIVSGLTPEAVIKSMAIASGLGCNSAYTWLKLPYMDNTERAAEISTLPSFILGGKAPKDAGAVLEKQRIALQQPSVFGLVVGRSSLFPADNDVAKAVDNTAGSL